MKQLSVFLFSLLFITALPAQFSVKKVVLEDYTGAWCGYCPEGALIMEDILTDYPTDVVGLAMHQGDAMMTPETDTLSQYYVTGYPEGNVNRKLTALSRNTWRQNCTNQFGSCAVSVSLDSVIFDSVTRNLSVKVNAQFTGPVTGDIRLNLVIAENKVVGSGTGYDQTNYFNATAGHALFGRGNPILGWEHNHVYRQGLGGPWGLAGIIPASVNFGSNHSYTFTTTLNPAWDWHEIFVVGLVQKFGPNKADREILNSEWLNLYTPPAPVALSSEKDVFGLQVYPNPADANSAARFELNAGGEYTLEVVSADGRSLREVFSGYMNAGIHTFHLPTSGLSNGLYLVSLRSGRSVQTCRLQVNH